MASAKTQEMIDWCKAVLGIDLTPEQIAVCEAYERGEQIAFHPAQRRTTLTKNWDSPLIPGRSGW